MFIFNYYNHQKNQFAYFKPWFKIDDFEAVFYEQLFFFLCHPSLCIPVINFVFISNLFFSPKINYFKPTFFC